jgi:hypothetical protein
MGMHHYDSVPQQLQDKIVEKARAARHASRNEFDVGKAKIFSLG